MRSIVEAVRNRSLPVFQSSKRNRSLAGRNDKSPRPALGLACVPIAALAVGATLGLVHSRSEARSASVRWGQLTRTDAEKVAQQRLAPLLGVAVQTLTPQTAYPVAGTISRREKTNGTTVRSWQVLLSGNDQRYLVRLNAETGQVYGFNRLDAGVLDAETEPAANPSLFGEQSELLSQQEGLLRARQCLRRLGVPPEELQPFGASRAARSEPTASVPHWNFVYRRPVPGWGARTVIVSINRQTGALDNFWNPTGAFTAL